MPERPTAKTESHGKCVQHVMSRGRHFLYEADLEVSLLALTLALIISDLTVSADMELSTVLAARLTKVGRPLKLLTNKSYDWW